MEIFLQQSASDFLTSGLGDESRARQSSCRRGIVDLIDEGLVERNVDSHRPACIGKQGNSKQHCSSLDGCFDILVAQDGIHGSCRRQPPARTFQRLRMLTKSRGSIRHGFFQGLSGRKTSFDIRKPDAKGAAGFFFHNRYVMRRHRFETFSHLRSRTPTCHLVDPANESCRQISSRMRHGDDRLPTGIFERVMIAVHPIKYPSVLLQHPDQLPAVSFHRAHLVESGQGGLGANSCSIGRASVPLPFLDMHFPSQLLCMYIHNIYIRQAP